MAVVGCRGGDTGGPHERRGVKRQGRHSSYENSGGDGFEGQPGVSEEVVE
jgi:hypothetical protein